MRARGLQIVHDSKVLVGNAQDKPTHRELHVYTPTGWSERQRLPLLVDMPGFGGTGPIHTAWKPLAENVPERLDRLIAEGMPPVAVAFPDCAMRIGGNQYINSAGTGRYEDYLIDEIVPHVEERFGCGGPRAARLLRQIVRRLRHDLAWPQPCRFLGRRRLQLGRHGLGRAAYSRALPVARRAAALRLVDRAFLRRFRGQGEASRAEMPCRMFLAMSAHYDPDASGFRHMSLPADPYTAELIPDKWANWLRYDPVLVADRRGGALKQLKTLWLDCGDHDQFRIHFGMRRLHRKLEAQGVAHIYEEFDDDHTDVDYRMNRFLPVLAKALSA